MRCHNKTGSTFDSWTCWCVWWCDIFFLLFLLLLRASKSPSYSSVVVGSSVGEERRRRCCCHKTKSPLLRSIENIRVTFFFSEAKKERRWALFNDDSAWFPSGISGDQQGLLLGHIGTADMDATGHKVLLEILSSIETLCDCSGNVCTLVCLAKTGYLL